MSDLLGCAIFMWCLSIVLGIALIDSRLSRINRVIDAIDRERRKGGAK